MRCYSGDSRLFTQLYATTPTMADPVAAAYAANIQAIQTLSEAMLALQANSNHSKVNLPSFWSHDPAGWFLHAEAQFTYARIPDNSYVGYINVVRALPSEVLSAVCDITRDIAPTTTGPYMLLKTALLHRYTISPLQRCYRMLDMPALGDRRPSALYAEMTAQLHQEANYLINAIFLRKLPAYMRAQLSSQAHLHPRELAAAADLLVDCDPSAAASVTSAAAATAAAVTAPSQGRSRSRSPAAKKRPQTPARTRSPANRSSPAFKQPLPQPPASSTLCFYHYHFKKQARKCQAPCTWQEN